MDPFDRGGEGHQPYGGPNPYQGGGGRHDSRAGWTNVRNHKLKAMMDPYLDWYNGQIHLTEVLNAAGKRQQDLPMLPRFCYANGQPFLCWNSMLGRCMWKADTPVLMTSRMTWLTKSLVSSQQGFRHLCRQGGGDGFPGKKVKPEPINLT
jgi:hypothetical protein